MRALVSGSLGRAVVGVFVVLIAFGGGLALGRSQRPAAMTTTSTDTATVPATDDGPTHTENGVPVGYTHTRSGVAAAATAYATALGGPLVLDRASYQAALTTMSAPGSSAVVDAALANRDLLMSHLDTSYKVSTAPPGGVVLRVVPVSYHVDTYTDGAASVSVWQLGVFAINGKFAPVGTWETGTYTLAWTGTDWRLATTPVSADGPVPSQAQTSGTDLALPEPLRSFLWFGYVPAH